MTASILWQPVRGLCLLVLLATVTGCGTAVTNYVTGESVRGAYTWPQEVQIGQQLDEQLRAQYGFYDDPALQAYVDELGERVLQNSAYGDPSVVPAEIRNTPFYFRVLDSDVVNAFAAPGGYIYISRGLLAFTENEAQLAVVLGHEIGHVLARHTSRRMAQAQTGQVGLLGAAILGDVLGGGQVAQGILDIGGTGVQLLFLSHSRDAEREADRAGVAYAEFSGYDAAEAASFFGSLQRLGAEAGADGIPSFLSTHPDPGERQQTIPQLAAQYDPRGTTVNREAFFSQIENMVLGQNPRQGFVEGGTYYHPELRFRFNVPQGWRVDNQAARVMLGEPNGRAIMEFTFAADQSSAQAAGRAFAAQQGFTATDQQSGTLDGLPAYTVTGTAQSQQQQLSTVNTFIEYGGNVYRFSGYSAAGDFSTYRPTFTSAIGSFARETRSEIVNRQPVRLEIVRVNQATPFRQLLQGRPVPQGMTQQQLAIMNEVELNTTIPAGRSVKLPSR